MENQPSGPIPPSAAREQLRTAREAHDASVRRAIAPPGLILALSVFCGAQTIAPAYKGPGNVVTIVAVLSFLAELLKMSAQNQWRPLRSLPKPKWGVTEVTLISVAVLVGGVIGPHVLASHSNSALASWGPGAAVTVIVAACLFAREGFLSAPCISGVATVSRAAFRRADPRALAFTDLRDALAGAVVAVLRHPGQPGSLGFGSEQALVSAR